MVSIDTDSIRDRERSLQSSLLPGEESNGFLTRLVPAWRSRLIAALALCFCLGCQCVRMRARAHAYTEFISEKEQ